MSLDEKALRRDRAFLGHPAGLGWLSFTEFWERFSFYGMQTLLVLYMVHRLLKPGHIEHVIGFGPFRHVLEMLYGPLSGQALASAVFGLYAGLVYLVPILGGLLADQFTGRTPAVILGAGLMACGHFLMAFEPTFLFALAAILAGTGCFKGNLATQVGDLYGHDDPRRADAYQIYMIGVQLAVIGAPLVTSSLAVYLDWDWGFGAAGVGMLIGLSVYLSGLRNYPAAKAKALPGDAPTHPKLSGLDWRNLALLVFLIPVLAVGSVGNGQIFNAYLVWGEKAYDLNIFGFAMPVMWLLSFGSVVSTLTMAGSVAFWRWWATRWPEPDELAKITLGTGIAMLAPLVLAFAAALYAATGQRVSLGFAVVFEFVNDIGFANIFPVGLALFSRAAPRGLGGMMVAAFMTNLFFGNMLVGYLGGLLERMPGPSFWLLHAGLMAGSASILLFVRMTLGRSLSPNYVSVPRQQRAPA